MSVLLDICGVTFKVTLNNEYITRYIKNRFIGFVTDGKQKSKYEIVNIDNDFAKEKYEVLKNLHDEKDYYVYSSFFYNAYVIHHINFIVYDNREGKVYVNIIEDRNHTINSFSAVKICEIISHIINEHKIYCLHSSVATFNGDYNNGIAFIGKSGAGKTSLALSMYKKGEKITNDDVAYFTYQDNTMKVYKNTQFIGLDDYSLAHKFPEYQQSVVRKDGLELDKNRINLSNADVYCENIIIKRIVIVSSQREKTPSYKNVDQLSRVTHLIKSAIQFTAGSCSESLMRTLVDIASSVPMYCLIPADSIEKTIDFIYSTTELETR